MKCFSTADHLLYGHFSKKILNCEIDQMQSKIYTQRYMKLHLQNFSIDEECDFNWIFQENIHLISEYKITIHKNNPLLYLNKMRWIILYIFYEMNLTYTQYTISTPFSNFAINNNYPFFRRIFNDITPI